MMRDDMDIDGATTEAGPGIRPANAGALPPCAKRGTGLRAVPSAQWTLRVVPPAEPLGLDPDAMARLELEGLRERHRDLDLAIEALAARGTDPLAVRRLKKRKLMLRDRIAHLEDQLTPDIIA